MKDLIAFNYVEMNETVGRILPLGGRYRPLILSNTSIKTQEFKFGPLEFKVTLLLLEDPL